MFCSLPAKPLSVSDHPVGRTSTYGPPTQTIMTGMHALQVAASYTCICFTAIIIMKSIKVAGK